MGVVCLGAKAHYCRSASVRCRWTGWMHEGSSDLSTRADYGRPEHRGVPVQVCMKPSHSPGTMGLDCTGEAQ